MANRKSMPLLAELADILCSVSFGEIGAVPETQARYRTLSEPLPSINSSKQTPAY